jgi:geranyl-CoA carboxylase alpha subunit
MNTKSDRGWGTRGVLRWPLVLEINGEEVAWSVERVGSKCIVLYEKIAYSVLEVSRTDSTLSINVDGHVKRIHYCWSESTLFIDEDLAVSKLKIIDPYERSAESESTGRLVAPMMGRVVSVSSSIGKNVQVGDTIVVIEAMKMEHPVRAQIDGVLESFHVTVGDQVSAEQILGVVAPLENHNE